MALTIEHTEAEGTVLDGTVRGDGSAEVVRALGWRWGRGIGMWFVPRSRDAAPRRELLEVTAGRLRGAGFEVEVRVDAAVGDRAEVERRRQGREVDRAERLGARAGREQAAADGQYAAAARRAESIPLGQPILLGHHSQRRAERDAARIHGGYSKSIEHQLLADQARDAAARAAGAAGRRFGPVTVANRIGRLEASVRAAQRSLAAAEGTDGAWVTALRERLALESADLDYWRQVRAEQVASGVATNYGPDTVKAGDLVKVGGQWLAVVRANVKTVTVLGFFGHPGTTPWHQVRDHTPVDE